MMRNVLISVLSFSFVSLAFADDVKVDTKASPPVAVSAQAEFAKGMFAAISKKDWGKACSVYGFCPKKQIIKKSFGGLELLSLGTPFQKGKYPGWYIPYEIKLNNGETEKHLLAVRDDNPKKKLVFDGGL
jgi:hypothetical protein